MELCPRYKIHFRRQGFRERQKPRHAVNASCFQHIEADHSVIVHNHRVVRLDEAHAAHVSRQVEDVVDILRDEQAILCHPEINQVELFTEQLLRHVLVPFPVRRDHIIPSLFNRLAMCDAMNPPAPVTEIRSFFSGQ